MNKIYLKEQLKELNKIKSKGESLSMLFGQSLSATDTVVDRSNIEIN